MEFIGSSYRIENVDVNDWSIVYTSSNKSLKGKLTSPTSSILWSSLLPSLMAEVKKKLV